MKILVTDGDNRSALAVTRSLGRKGYHVIVTSITARSLASTSKYCQLGHSIPDPSNDSTNYLNTVCAISKREAIDIVIPMTDQSINILNPAREFLPNRTKLACPPTEMMLAISDKSNLCRLATKLDIPIPKIIYLNSADELPANFARINWYPVVVKPALSSTLVGQRFLSGAIRYASSPDELEQLYATNPVLRYPSMIQEKIVGPGTGLFTLYDGNRHLALFSHRRVREKPPSGGVSVVSESIPLDQEMVDSADKLLSAVGWKGVAMVEFKRDQRDGKAKLMEINGRFWGSLQLAIACGVDFPALLLDYLQGNMSEPLRSDYQTGHKLKWFCGTLDHLLIRLKNSDQKLNLPPKSPSKLQATRDFFNIFEENTSFDVYDRDDPGPFWYEARAYIRHALKING